MSLRDFAADALAIDERLTGATAASRDMKTRFEKFGADATASLDLAAGQRRAQAAFRQDDRRCRRATINTPIDGDRRREAVAKIPFFL